ncbi:uncharacterized protein DUF4192 [Leucobacter luti]|uniref:Uncharacterized protein DUF4192 n=1 Tax=Leucobacter luti TaxID=340320 RepID=A0A4R6RXF5_9MICO|nr:DUF4192 family protein [Leucobacter luti]TDP91673.1 uncharacterized protein DUF4192 [Leucobacter luti]
MSPLHVAPAALSAPVVQCHTTADFLAALPFFLGFTPRNSLVAVMFSGSRSRTGLRLDLPRDNSRETAQAVSSTLLTALESLRGAPRPGIPDTGRHAGVRSAAREYRPAVALVLATNRRFTATSGAPCRTFASGIAQELIRSGFEVRELSCLAANGWVNYLEPDPPPLGHPLEDIVTSPVALSARLRSEHVPDFAALGKLPDPEPQRATAIAAALATDSRCTSSQAKPISIERTAAAARRLRAPEPLSIADSVDLIRTLATPAQWVGVVFGLMKSPEATTHMMSDPTTSQFFAQLSPQRDGAGNEHYPAVLGIFSGLGVMSPGRERLTDVRDRLQTATAECPSEHRIPLLALCALAWWLSGLQSVAHRHIEAARAINSAHPLVLTMLLLISTPAHLTPGAHR